MALLAIAIPILPGKRQQWDQFMAELQGPRYEDFAASRRRIGAHERTFLQETPQGDMVIVTLEADDPGAAIAQFGAGNDEFTDWFVQQVQEIHGFDLRGPLPGPPPRLVMDSQRRV